VSSGLSEFFFYFLLVQHVLSLAQFCVLLGLADGREWAHKKLVAVLPAVAEQNAAARRGRRIFTRATQQYFAE